MQISISARPDATAALDRLRGVLAGVRPRVVACSGGIDSLVLAVVAHRESPNETVIAHTVTPAVPQAGTDRVRRHAIAAGWDLRVVESGEFDDEAYLANPVDRCFHCKSNLYRAIDAIGADSVRSAGATTVSGANVDDLGEYRPGLRAAAEHDVRHPYVEAGITKSDVRAIARSLGLAEADLPASPCLASRLYTGTRVTPERVRAVEAGEARLQALTGIDVARCRIADTDVRIEVDADDRDLVTEEVVSAVFDAMTAVEPSLASIQVDERGYRPGRAFVGAPDVVPS